MSLDSISTEESVPKETWQEDPVPQFALVTITYLFNYCYIDGYVYSLIIITWQT